MENNTNRKYLPYHVGEAVCEYISPVIWKLIANSADQIAEDDRKIREDAWIKSLETLEREGFRSSLPKDVEDEVVRREFEVIFDFFVDEIKGRMFGLTKINEDFIYEFLDVRSIEDARVRLKEVDLPAKENFEWTLENLRLSAAECPQHESSVDVPRLVDINDRNSMFRDLLYAKIISVCPPYAHETVAALYTYAALCEYYGIITQEWEDMPERWWTRFTIKDRPPEGLGTIFMKALENLRSHAERCTKKEN